MFKVSMEIPKIQNSQKHLEKEQSRRTYIAQFQSYSNQDSMALAKGLDT